MQGYNKIITILKIYIIIIKKNTCVHKIIAQKEFHMSKQLISKYTFKFDLWYNIQYKTLWSQTIYFKNLKASCPLLKSVVYMI